MLISPSTCYDNLCCTARAPGFPVSIKTEIIEKTKDSDFILLKPSHILKAKLLLILNLVRVCRPDHKALNMTALRTVMKTSPPVPSKYSLSLHHKAGAPAVISL